MLTILALTHSLISFAGPSPYIPIGKARTKKTVIAIAPVMAGPKAQQGAKEVYKTLFRDLTFMSMFEFLPSSSFIEDPTKAGLKLTQFKLSDWTSIGTELLIKSSVQVDGKNFVLEGYLYDVNRARILVSKRYVATQSDVLSLAHNFGNDIVEAITGLPGVFLTKIAMVCNRTGHKEIYTMNFDGTNVRQITFHRSLSFSPAWSPDGVSLAYTLVRRHKNNVKNHDLFEFNFNNGSFSKLSNRVGMNSGASYSPDGSEIALTMSFLDKNPEIFILNRKKRNVTRLTRSRAIDVDPSYSPDGKFITFVSDRSGRPMVYSMKRNGTQVQRLTYAGQFNASPDWSPQNNKIVFAGWLEGRFDLFIMNPNGTKIERLTKNQGSNEDPNFSPDGNFITFASNRTGKWNVYVTNLDGTSVKRLTYGLGDCQTPRWSAPPKSP